MTANGQYQNALQLFEAFRLLNEPAIAASASAYGWMIWEASSEDACVRGLTGKKKKHFYIKGPARFTSVPRVFVASTPTHPSLLSAAAQLTLAICG